MVSIGDFSPFPRVKFATSDIIARVATTSMTPQEYHVPLQRWKIPTKTFIRWASPMCSMVVMKNMALLIEAFEGADCILAKREGRALNFHVK